MHTSLKSTLMTSDCTDDKLNGLLTLTEWKNVYLKTPDTFQRLNQ